MKEGGFTRFADWRFIHRARLNYVPLNGNRDQRCRRCGHAKETLPHVLCHCPPHFQTITRRHNAILDRVVKAFNAPANTRVRINQTVPGCSEDLRPDFVALDDITKTAHIINVTTPFENKYEAFQAARREKIEKYGPITEQLRQQGYTVTTDAFIVDALGGWEPANDMVLRTLNIVWRYARLMKKLMCSDAIKWSRDIYRRLRKLYR